MRAATLYTPPFSTLRNPLYSCQFQRHDMRFTRVIPAFPRHRISTQMTGASRFTPRQMRGCADPEKSYVVARQWMFLPDGEGYSTGVAPDSITWIQLKDSGNQVVRNSPFASACQAIALRTQR